MGKTKMKFGRVYRYCLHRCACGVARSQRSSAKPTEYEGATSSVKKYTDKKIPCYCTAGFSRRIQFIRCPFLSTSGSMPKYLRSEFAQLNRSGLLRFFCLNSTNRAVDVRLFERGASSPK